MSYSAGQKVSAAQLNDGIVRGIRFVADGVTSPQSFTSGTTTTVQWPVAQTPDSSILTVSGTNNTTFTCVKAGFYLIETALRLVNTTTSLEVSIKVNGVRMSAGIGTFLTSCASSKRLIVGDTVTVTAIHASGSTKAVEGGAEETSHVSIARLSE